MRRSISAAVVVAAAAGSMIAASAGLPATARPTTVSWPDHGAAVTGTYSSGSAQKWQPLPTDTRRTG